MARGKKKNTAEEAEVSSVAEVLLQPITETLEKNYMPYVMSVIVSRAIPEIDGFKPSHRKLLYTMYKMGLLNGGRTKSTNVVGQTMKLNPHGDASIYETMVRLTRGHEALLHPFIDSKGSFGKHYSRDMAFAQSRYTEVKLDKICEELFDGMDSNAVDMVDNYDSTMKEPLLLPTSFPNILVSSNKGIAVSMASNICSFNLGEICDGTIQLLKNPLTDVDTMMNIIKAPDFSGGGYLLYDREKLKKIYETGVGSFKLRAKYEYDKANNSIDIVEIPYSTYIEDILSKITDLVKEGKLREVVDFRDAIDIDGFKLTIDLRKGVDPDKLMVKLYKMTPLESSVSCNFNVLIDGLPMQLGVIGILNEWIKFRVECVRRTLQYELDRNNEKLHLLLGLTKILIDIDKAIKIIRETKFEKDVIPNLMEGFDIDQIQAEFIAEIKLRYLNLEYILKRAKEIENLQARIEELEKTIGSEKAIKKLIAFQLKEIKERYEKPRKTHIVYESEVDTYDEKEFIENYNVQISLSKEGYFKKITFASLRGNDEQKLKDGDEVIVTENVENKSNLIFFTDKAQLYRSRVCDFDTVKASALGDYIPAKLSFDDGEKTVTMKTVDEYRNDHNMIFLFENGKGVRVPMDSYETKGNRKKLTNVFSMKSPIVAAFYESEPIDILLVSNVGRAIVIKSTMIPIKTTRTSGGVQLFTLKKNQYITGAYTNFEDRFAGAKKCKKIKIPAAGVLLDDYNIEKQQISL